MNNDLVLEILVKFFICFFCTGIAQCNNKKIVDTEYILKQHLRVHFNCVRKPKPRDIIKFST